MSVPDDEPPPLRVDTKSENFQLTNRFTNVQALGYGSSGLVLSAYDKTLAQKVAVKRISLAGHSHRALREVRFIRKLKHENIVHLLDILGPDCNSVYSEESGLGELSCVYLVEDCLDTDLHSLIQGRQLNESHAKWFVYQVLRGIRYIHSANLIHRDLKPSNVVVNTSNLLLKITDFGSCRVLDPSYDHRGYLTERVGSCWYRSPEQILTPRNYTRAVDLWSVGCIMAEMLLGRPLFAGANELNQVMQFLDTVHLEEEDWGEVLHVMPNKMLKNHPFRPRRPLAEQFTDIDSDVLDLLEQLLRFNSVERWSAEQALAHSYLSEYACVQDEPTAHIVYHIEHEVEDEPPLATCEEDRVESSSIQIAGDSQPGGGFTNRSQGTQRQVEMTNPLPMVVLDEMHTLDEILHLSDEEMGISAHGGSTDELSCKSTSVEDLNLRNLRNSQENLCKTPSSQNILSLSDEESFCTRQNEQNSSTDTQHIKPSDATENDDEKDIAEISEEKQAEDEELKSMQSFVSDDCKNVDIVTANVENDGYRSAFAVDCYKELRVNLQVAENYKEYSQVSPKQGRDGEDKNAGGPQQQQVEPRSGVNNGESHSETCSQSTKPKLTARRTHYSGENSEESIKEKKLLEFYNKHRASSKFAAENKENEKIKKKRSGRNSRNGHNVDMDEMYRLPTEHLCVDRDYSNQRIKQRNLMKMQRQCLARYRDEINEINERLKEATLDGAVGGVVDIPDELQQHHHGGDIQGVSIPEPSAGVRGREHEYVNQRVLGGMQRRRTQSETAGLSSPEELPSSPRASFSSGARPKKSPRKQKAL